MLDPDFLLCELLPVPPDVADHAASEISGCEMDRAKVFENAANANRPEAGSVA